MTDERGTVRFQANTPGRYELTVRARGRTGGERTLTIPVEVLAPDP